MFRQRLPTMQRDRFIQLLGPVTCAAHQLLEPVEIYLPSVRPVQRHDAALEEHRRWIIPTKRTAQPVQRRAKVARSGFRRGIRPQDLDQLLSRALPAWA